MNSMLSALQSRASTPARQLVEPAPDDEQLEQILRCAVAAPDHAKLCPWRFIVIRGKAREALGNVMVRAALEKTPDLSAAKQEALREKPLRSPMIVVIVATITAAHPKTPEVEQLLSAGAAATLLQLGASALGFGSVWLTGANAYDANVKESLGVASADHIAGFLYLGTPEGNKPERARPDIRTLLSEWHGEQ